MKQITDERIQRFKEIMTKQYNWDFTNEEIEDIYTVVDRIKKEMSSQN